MPEHPLQFRQRDREPRGQQVVEAVSYAQTREYRAYVVTAMAPKEQFKKLFADAMESWRRRKIK